MLKRVQIIKLIVPAMLAVLTMYSCCKHDKVAVEKDLIVMGASSVSSTKGAISSLNDLKSSNQDFGVFGYKTRPVDQSYDIYRLFNNTPVQYDSDEALWSYSPLRYWDSNTTVSYQFFAYWPHLASSDPGNGTPWVSATDISNLNSTEDMSMSLYNIPNWQDASDPDCIDLLTSLRVGKYRSDDPDPENRPLFYDRVVNFDFSHILSKLIVQGYYVGEQNNHVKIYSITLNGTEYLLPGATSNYQKTIAASSFSNVQKGAAQQSLDQVLYSDANGIQLLETAFKASEQAEYTPTPICAWLLVPTNGWSNLSLSVTYAIGSAAQQTSEVNQVSIGAENVYAMESGKSYILNLKFNTEGGIELQAMYINSWVNYSEELQRPVYNW